MSEALRILTLIAICGAMACRDEAPADSSLETSGDTSDTSDPSDTAGPEPDTSPDTTGPDPDLGPDASLDIEPEVEPEVVAQRCGPLSPLDLSGVSACLGPASASCPTGTREATRKTGLLLCVDASSTATPTLTEALAAHCGPTAGALETEDTAGCLFITVTGFICPPHLTASELGGWTACAPDTAMASALPEAFCASIPGAAGPAVLIQSADHAACALGITVTGFDCPPPLSAIHSDRSLGVCGDPGLPERSVALLNDAYCGADHQYLGLGGLGACARFITVTGFLPCPAHHQVERVAAPFSVCSSRLLTTAEAAEARAEVCRGEGVLADLGRASVCAYDITVTGFDCPPLMTNPTLAASGPTICSPTPSPPTGLVDDAAAFAESPWVCAWENQVTGAFSQRLAGVGPTPSGTLIAGSVASLVSIGLPGDEALMTVAPHNLFAAQLNVNGSLSDARLIGHNALGLYACGGLALDPAGRWHIGVGARGNTTFGEGERSRVVDFGLGGTGVAIFDPLGRLLDVLVTPAGDRADLRRCALAVDPSGAISLLHTDDFSDAPPELVRFVDGAVAWREPAPDGAALGVVAHDDGGFSLAGRFEGAFGELSSDGLFDGWVVRYGDAGDAVWTGRLGGRDEDAVTALATDGQDLFVTGYVSLDATWEVDGQTRDIPDELPDINHLDMVLLRVAADGTPRWHTRARGEGNNEGRVVALGLDGAVHVGGLGAARVRFGAGADAPGFSIDSRLFFYAGWVASFDPDTGAARSAWATSDTAPVITAMWVVGHPDSTTTWVGNALGIGAYGVDPERRTTIGQEINATIFMVHTPDPRCR